MLLLDLFALNATREFWARVATALGTELAAHEEREFEDGEHKARPLVSVRGHDVYVIQSLHSGPVASVNDKLCRLLFFISTLKENGAKRVTAVIPYLAYARKDRQTKPRDPVTTRYVAVLLEAAGAGLVMTLEVHNIVAFQNAFRCQTIHLDPRKLFARQALELIGDGPVVVASPDPGGVKRACAASYARSRKTTLAISATPRRSPIRRWSPISSSTGRVGNWLKALQIREGLAYLDVRQLHKAEAPNVSAMFALLHLVLPSWPRHSSRGAGLKRRMRHPTSVDRFAAQGAGRSTEGPLQNLTVERIKFVPE
jgi:phosphoribosylpyrophosphate synthetase